MPKLRAQQAKKLTGLKAKLYNKQRFKEKLQMQKTIKMHQKKQSNSKKESEDVPQGALPPYLLDRETQKRFVTRDGSVSNIHLCLLRSYNAVF